MIRKTAYDGLYNRKERHGTIQGHGPMFLDALRKFNTRQLEASLPGVWRHSRYDSNGSYVDLDYVFILDGLPHSWDDDAAMVAAQLLGV